MSVKQLIPSGNFDDTCTCKLELSKDNPDRYREGNDKKKKNNNKNKEETTNVKIGTHYPSGK